jgi:hypothetical protein
MKNELQKKILINLVLPLINGNKKISFVMLPGGSDPNDIINKDVIFLILLLIGSRTMADEMRIGVLRHDLLYKFGLKGKLRQHNLEI